MGVLDDAFAADPNLLAHLDPGETVVAVLAQVALAPSGDERIVTAPPAPDATEPGHRLGPAASIAGGVASIGAAALGPTGWSGGGLPLTVLGGVRVAGGDGSLGVRLYRAVRGRSGSAVLTVTDRRMLVLERGRDGSAGRTFSLIQPLPRADLVGARRRGRLGSRGRVELYFADASMIALMTGAVSTRPAQRLLAALGLPESPPVG